LGTSNWQNISYNIELVRKLNPHSMLDVGVGFGRWGILFREFLEIWEHGKYEGNWDRIIDGIEIFPGYLQDYHKFFYNNIYTENALVHLRKTKKQYDLINCGDIIEHFTKDEGLELIDLCLQKGKYVLINIPVGENWEQEGTKENPHEAHRSMWHNKDFKKYKYFRIKKFTDLALRDFSVILLSNNKIEFDNRFGKHFYAKNIMKNKLGLKKTVEKIEKRKR